MKTKWVKETPKEEGWYWIKYKTGKENLTCPCAVIHLKEAIMVRTAFNTTFIEGPNHGGKGLKWAGDTKVDKSIRFGPRIPMPK